MLGDTIFAVASPPGPGDRAVLRLSGPGALQAAAVLVAPAPPRRRCQWDAAVTVLGRSVACFALVMPGPGSYTGEDVVELHVPGSPLLVAQLFEALGAAPAELALRPALPGEFTRRAFENGRLDLGAAEGVLALIHSGSEAERARALALLRGGLTDAVQAVRSEVQEALALLEAGLDFTTGETGEVAEGAWRPRLTAAQRGLAELEQQLPAARSGGEILLLGAANAGKSSLCNALAGHDAVLVDGAAGTTRDIVRVPLAGGPALWDSPGDLADRCHPEPRPPEPGRSEPVRPERGDSDLRPSEPSHLDVGPFDRAAIELRDRLGGEAAAAMVVLDPRAPHVPRTHLPVLAAVATRADLGVLLAGSPLPSVPLFTVSSTTGAGIAELRAFLCGRARGGAQEIGGPQRQAAGAASAALDRALRSAAAGAGAEVVAVDLQAVLRELDAICGAHCPEDLLDRIFGRFCLGK